MPVFEDWLKNPISIVNNLFASDPTNYDQKIQEYFENKLKSEKTYHSIPCLNDLPIHELTPNSLVRYRCMIQDSFDPVFFSPTQKLKNKKTDEVVTHTLKYKEIFEYSDECEPFNEIESHGSGNANLQQRVTFYCVPIPGENEWVKKIYRSNNTSGCAQGSSSNTSHRPSKRGIDLENDCNEVNATTERPLHDNSNLTKNITQNPANDSPQTAAKKPNNSVATVCNSCFKVKQGPSQSESKSGNVKKTKADEADETKSKQSSNSMEFHLNFPLPSNETGVACLVKIYDNYENIKLNEMYEFIGILSQDPSLAYVHDDNVCSSEQVQKLHEQQIAEFSKITLQNSEENSMETEINQGSSHSIVCNCDDKIDLVKNSQKVILSNFPPSLVPRLHCLKAYRLPHDNPLVGKNKTLTGDENAEYWKKLNEQFIISLNRDVTSNVTTSIDAALLEKSHMYLSSLRKELLDYLQELLLGDSLAAEYLLMNLISNVFMRRDVTVLGKFSLNIFNIPKCIEQPNINQENNNALDKNVIDSDSRTFASCFYNTLKNILTMSYMFKMTTDTLNKSNLIPNKDYNKDKLLTGMLQLPDCFHLIIDETQLSTGALDQKGLLNVNSIKEVINWQKLSYDFSYHQQEFHTNLKVLILSETKSILPFDAQLKLKANIESFDAEKYINYTNGLMNNTKSQFLDNIRKYLTIVSQIDYKLGEPMQKIVEDDIVKLRQTTTTESNTNQKEKIKIEDLHLLLVVARLQAISFGKTELSITEWNKAKLLENERLTKRN